MGHPQGAEAKRQLFKDTRGKGLMEDHILLCLSEISSGNSEARGAES